MVRELMRHKEINLNARDSKGLTASQLAADNGHSHVVQELLGHDAIHSKSATNDGQTALNGHFDAMQD